MDLTILKDTSPWNWPHGASQQFRNILRDDRANETDRLLAAEMAGEFTVINEALLVRDALQFRVLVRDTPPGWTWRRPLCVMGSSVRSH